MEKNLTRSEFVSTCVWHNLFELYTSVEHDLATKDIANLLYDFKIKYDKLQEKHKHVGIGDTDTDRMVEHVFYNLIHFDIVEKWDVEKQAWIEAKA